MDSSRSNLAFEPCRTSYFGKQQCITTKYYNTDKNIEREAVWLRDVDLPARIFYIYIWRKYYRMSE